MSKHPHVIFKPGPHPAVVTGIGIVSSLGVGARAHSALLAAPTAPPPAIDSVRFPPYSVHPLPEIDWSTQIPKRGDQRQMETWQRLGVYAAGLALDDALMKDDAEACSTMDMIVAAGGGERDIAVDTLIVEEARARNDREVLLNEKLTTELRPTLFLAQLSNLLAGNISIVHKVTGSSRTFMGEEGAGVSAFETAVARIASGQSTHCLVGGAYVAERFDMILSFEPMGYLQKGPNHPFWQREQETGGVNLGSGAAFLVLESLDHALARGARIYAHLNGVAGDRGPRGDGGFEQRLSDLADSLAPDEIGDGAVVFTGATGVPEMALRERHFLARRFPLAALRTQAALFGHSVEAQFPMGLALACLALHAGTPVCPFAQDIDAALQQAATTAIVTAAGHQRGEGLAVLSAYHGGSAAPGDKL